MARALVLGGVIALLAVLAACSSGAPVVATFTRTWADGRVETLELYGDGRVLMDHAGYIDRVTLSAADTETLVAALADIAPATDVTAFPRLSLVPADGQPVIVDTAPGTAGALFLSVLDRHRLP